MLWDKRMFTSVQSRRCNPVPFTQHALLENITNMTGIGSPSASGGTNSPNTAIVLRRSRSWARDFLRAYAVFIDGHEAGRIRRGQCREYEVPPGSHTVHLKIDWCTSQGVEVHVRPNTKARLTCAPGGSPFRAIQDVTAGASNYINLEHDETNDRP
jgi:hypothetical protein